MYAHLFDRAEHAKRASAPIGSQLRKRPMNLAVDTVRSQGAPISDHGQVETRMLRGSGAVASSVNDRRPDGDLRSPGVPYLVALTTAQYGIVATRTVGVAAAAAPAFTAWANRGHERELARSARLYA